MHPIIKEETNKYLQEAYRLVTDARYLGPEASQALSQIAIGMYLGDIAEATQSIAASLEKLANPANTVYSETPEEIADRIIDSNDDLRKDIVDAIRQERFM